MSNFKKPCPAGQEPRRASTRPMEGGAERAKAVGGAIRAARGELSQQGLADLCGVSQMRVSRWERGEADLTLEEVRTIEAVLGREPGSIFTASGYVPQPDGASASAARTNYYTTRKEAVAAFNAASVLDLQVQLQSPAPGGASDGRWWTLALMPDGGAA
jgi:transcriptional regulator with XRE-family HTH domain